MSESPKTQPFAHSDPRVQAALAYTQGDIDKAEKMASGEYQDIKVLKGKYSLAPDSIYGNFMLFCNIDHSVLVNISVIQHSDSAQYGENDPAAGWKEYFKTCEKIAGQVSLADTSALIPHLSASLAEYDIFGDLASGDIPNATKTITEILSKFFNSEKVEAVLSVETTSSLELFEERIPIAEIRKKAQDQQASSSQADTRPEIEKKYPFVIEAKATVSPINGKRVADLVPGDHIILTLVNRDGASLKIAEALHAFDENRNFLPIKGKYLEKVAVEKIGYYLYCSLAKNAIAKIPEEGNVLIEVAEGTPRVTIDDVQKTKKDVNRNLMMYIAMLLGLISLAALIIYVLI